MSEILLPKNLYFHRNNLTEATTDDRAFARELAARGMGYTNFAALEQAALSESAENTLDALKKSRDEQSRLTKQMAEAAKREFDAIQLECDRRGLNDLLFAARARLQKLHLRDASIEKEINLAMDAIRDVLTGKNPLACANDFERRRAALELLVELPIIQRLIPSAIRDLEDTIAGLIRQLKEIK